MGQEITEDFMRKAVEFAINRVVYNQENEVWASAMIGNVIQNVAQDLQPIQYLQQGLILGYAMRYIECKAKGLKDA